MSLLSGSGFRTSEVSEVSGFSRRSHNYGFRAIWVLEPLGMLLKPSWESGLWGDSGCPGESDERACVDALHHEVVTL